MLEGDYSGCLQLLLKYPAPKQPDGPNTFVSDALYLRSHLNATGGATLIKQYSDKFPAITPTSPRSPDSSSRPSTPSFRSFHAFRQRAVEARRSSLRSPPSFMNQQVGVETLFQNAAKGARGVFERGEKLGINQAVRDAVGEIRRNVQGFNESRQSPRREGSTATVTTPHEVEAAMTALAALEQRNQQLAGMLEETVASLKEVSASNLDDKTKSLELIEIAAAKVQFVKIYLEDPSMEVPTVVTPPSQDTDLQVDEEALRDALREGPTPAKEDIPQISSLSLADSGPPPGEVKTEKPPVTEEEKPPLAEKEEPAALETGEPLDKETLKPSDPLSEDQAQADNRPRPVPRRSALAQSSFSWMLEPTDTSPASSRNTSKSPPATGHKKGPSGSASRERNAFLFGEVANGGDASDNLRSDDIFGMEPLRKAPSKN